MGTLVWQWVSCFVVFFGFFFMIIYVPTSLFCHFCTWLWIFLPGFCLKDYGLELIWSTWLEIRIMLMECDTVFGSCFMMITVLIVNVGDDPFNQIEFLLSTILPYSWFVCCMNEFNWPIFWCRRLDQIEFMKSGKFKNNP